MSENLLEATLEGSDEFVRECRSLGAESAAAKMRLDERGPHEYRQAFTAYRGAKNFPAYFHRKWLSLRLSAVKRGMVVDATVTPGFLERITDGRCPVTLDPLDVTGRSPQNPSVDRLVNEVTYRAGNICVLSMRANRAKGDRTFEDVVEIAQGGDDHLGLAAVEWMRLASLMYGAWARALKRADPYLLPLAATPGPGMFMSTSQVVQMLLMRHYNSGPENQEATARWLKLTVEAGGLERDFRSMATNLADALAREDHPGNAWLHSEVFEGFVTWYSRCKNTLVPAVEGLLQWHQDKRADPVATLQWPQTGRYWQ